MVGPVGGQRTVLDGGGGRPFLWGVGRPQRETRHGKLGDKVLGETARVGCAGHFAYTASVGPHSIHAQD